MKKKVSLIKLIRLWGIVFIIAIGGSLIILDVISSYLDFNYKIDKMREDYIISQKQMIRREVIRVAGMIHLYNKSGLKVAANSQIKKDLLLTISKIRFGREGYIFINRLNGDTLVSNGKLYSGEKKLWELFDKDPEKMRNIFTKEYKAAMKTDGDYIYYSFFKLTRSKKHSPKVSFIYGIPELKWLIGAGVYLDDVEEDIGIIRAGLIHQIKNKTIYFIMIVIGIILLFIIFLNLLTNKLKNDYKLFISFFNKSVLSKEVINRDKIQFIELDRMAENANKMRIDLINSEENFKDLFNDNPLSLWEEDFAEVENILNEIKKKGFIVSEKYFDKNPDIFADCVSAIRILNINKATLNLLKYKTADDLVDNIAKTFNEKSIKTFKRELVEIAKGGTYFSEESELVCSDGEIISVIVQFQILKGYKNIVFTITDITERKHAENKLKKSEENYRDLFNDNPLALWEEDFSEVKKKLDDKKKKGVIISKEYFDENIDFFNECRSVIKLSNINMATLKLLNYKSLNDLEKNNSKVLNNKTYETIKNEFVAIAYEETSFSEESELVRSDGKIIEVIVKFQVIGTYQKILFSIIDITGRKRAEEELKKIQMLKSVGTLAGGIAHDFNNILMGLFGNISLAKAKLSKDHPGLIYLEEAERSMNWATRLTKQLLTFSKGGAPVKEDIGIKQLVEEVIRFDLSGSNVKPVFKLSEDLWLAEVDKGQIQQVFSNLTINANQAMPDGGHLYITLENAEIPANLLPGLVEGRYIKITMSDEGIGIDQKYIDRIFEPYFSTKQTGSGLGLATVYSIIKKHDGYICMDSELGKGTEFTMYLPASKVLQIPEKQELESQPAILKQRGKILVMDDEVIVCEVTSQMLESLGFSVEIAYDGNTATKMYKQSMDIGKPFDVIIMDLTIPGGLGGKEVVKDLLLIDPDVRAIVSSGYADDTVMANYSEYGFKGILKKPYVMTILQEELNRVLMQ